MNTHFAPTPTHSKAKASTINHKLLVIICLVVICYIPTLFIHGDADEVVPIEPSAKQGHKIVANSELHVIKGAPHGCVFTHIDEVNKTLLNFFKK